jgi:hypothetical protein
MQILKPFPLSHVALYAKGWYRKSDNIFEDLRKILEFDNYTPFTNADVVTILLRNYESSIKVSLVGFINEIHPTNSWKTGYMTQESMFKKEGKEFDLYESIIYKILSDVRFLSVNEWIPKIPRYNKDFKRPDSISLRDIYNHFVKSKIDEQFRKSYSYSSQSI